MSNQYRNIHEITADPVIVKAWTDHLVKAFEEFISEFDGDLDYSDGLMAAHNFHKAIVLHLVDVTDFPKWKNIAWVTFKQAMEDSE